jgi:hypothetical protein
MRRHGGLNNALPAQPLHLTGVERATHQEACSMNSIVYIVGAVVIVIAVLSFFGLR